MSDYGIDVASFNTIEDWTRVRAAGNTWAWSKATQGSGYTNPLFASQMASGQAAGLAMGAYHFPDPRVSVATNVAHFVSIARARNAFAEGAFIPMLDLENSAAEGITWSAGGANGFIPAFRDQLRAATGQRLLCVYASESWWASGFLTPSVWADDGVFLAAAQYTGQPGQLGWSHPRLAVHQYTDQAPTPGAQGLTDRSVLVGSWTLADLTVGGDMALDPKDPVVQQLLAGAQSVQFGQEGVRVAGDLAYAVDQLRTQVTALQGAETAEEAALLAALKALQPATVDAAAVAKALADGGLPAQLIAALLAVLSKAAA